jgi:hypothetical protein
MGTETFTAPFADVEHPTVRPGEGIDVETGRDRLGEHQKITPSVCIQASAPTLALNYFTPSSSGSGVREATPIERR